MREADSIHRAMVLIAGIEMENPEDPPRLWTALEDTYDALSDALGTDGDATADEEEAKAIGRHFVVRSSGDREKLREVVKELLDAMYDMGIDEETVSIAAESPNCHMHSVELLSVIKKAKAALAAPARNCDVGTAEEQTKRFDVFCNTFYKEICRCDDCPIFKAKRGKAGNPPRCQIAWAQMPYEEGGEK